MISLETSISPRDSTRVDVSDVAPIEAPSAANAGRSVEAVSTLNSSASDDRDNTRADAYVPEIRIDIAPLTRRLRAAPDGLHACPLEFIVSRRVNQQDVGKRKADDVCEGE